MLRDCQPLQELQQVVLIVIDDAVYTKREQHYRKDGILNENTSLMSEMSRLTRGQVLDQQSVTLVPVSGLVQMQGLSVSICITASSSGLGIVDPLLWDQQLLCQEALAADRLFRLLQGAMQGQHVPDGSLPLSEEVKHQLRSADSLLQ